MEEKKEGLFSKIFRLFGFIFGILFPSFKIIGLNSLLKRCKKIVKKEPWFGKQILLNYVLALVFLIPIPFTVYKIHSIISHDEHISQRLEVASKASLLSSYSAYKNVFIVNKKDSKKIKGQKIESQIRIIAVGIVILMFSFLQIGLGIIIRYYHPMITDANRLKKLLLQNGVIHKDDESTAIVFATPLGFLITITGQSARDIANMDRIWAGLNIKIKEYLEDPKERSVVFFKKAYELKEKYIYDEL